MSLTKLVLFAANSRGHLITHLDSALNKSGTSYSLAYSSYNTVT